jgi:hypothetical protein
MIIGVSLTNYFIFNHSDKWKGIVTEFDRWPKQKNKVGSIIFWSFFIALIGSVIIMFYFVSQINWQKIRQY